MIISRAPGKTILFGEHFVVYGAPAIAMALDKYVVVRISELNNNLLEIYSHNIGLKGVFDPHSLKPKTPDLEALQVFSPIIKAYELISSKTGNRPGVRIEIISEIPMASGLGSSAALAVAVLNGLARISRLKLSREELSQLAFQVEKIVHGTPSGIDNTVSTIGGFVFFQRRDDKLIVKPINVALKLNLVIGCTGKTRSTKDIVERVRRFKNTYASIFNNLLNAYNLIAEHAFQYLREGDIRRLGELMKVNHGLLWSIGVSSRNLDKLVNTALEAGAYGAKLTGAGGEGCIIALSDPDMLDNILKALGSLRMGPVFKASTSTSGASVEEV